VSTGRGGVRRGEHRARRDSGATDPCLATGDKSRMPPVIPLSPRRLQIPSMRVLVVEDEVEIADLLTRARGEVSWACDVAGTGAAALEALAVTEYDVVVLDLGLPNMDGLAVCRTWRSRRGCTPMLALTARTALDDRVTGLDAGVDDYLPTPFAIEELLARLRALLLRSGAPATYSPTPSHRMPVSRLRLQLAARFAVAVLAAVAVVDDLNRRLPVRAPPDEIDRLTERVNGLLASLAEARDRNRTFLARAAHQIKTPLTVVRGESTLGLERPRDNDTYRAALERIQRAADQMVRRVDDLFLLAQAEAGDRPPMQDAVELDGLALECTDLMRGRAQQTRHSLELERVEGAVARGNEPLLREALLELLENAVRYGEAARPIRVAAYAGHEHATLAVTSAGRRCPATHFRSNE